VDSPRRLDRLGQQKPNNSDEQERDYRDVENFWMIDRVGAEQTDDQQQSQI